MSSEMRYSDDDLCVIVQDWSESDPDQAVAINLARECLRHRALLARTEAGPSLLCQSDACAHKGTAHNFCTPRTEAGADGYDDGSGRVRDWRESDTDEVAELIAAADVLNTGAKLGLSTYPEDWKRLDAALAAMQAKEAK